MKVVLLAPLPPPYGGIASWTARMLKAELKNGWSVGAVDEKAIGERQVFGKDSKRDLLNEAKRCRNIWSNLKKELKDPDVKVVHSCIPSVATSMMREYICAKITKKRKRKFVIHFRCTVPNTTNGKFAWKMLRKICNASDMIFCLNEQSRLCLEKITNTPIKLIPNFIESTELLSEKNINKELKTALYVGGIVGAKGVKTIIETAKKMPEITFRLVGDGDKSIENYAKENDVTNVIFVGPKDRSGVKEELEKADVFLFLSHFRGEGFSNALCEAMAAGLPCVVTDWAANADMIGTEGGKVIGIEDAEAAVKALNEMKSFEVRKKQSEANIKKVATSYVDSIVLDMYVDAYEEILGV